jgi:hypothetical protein
MEKPDGEAITDARLYEVRPIQITKVINRNAYRLKFPKSTEVDDVFHVSLPDRYVNSVPINMSNEVPVNNRGTYIERRQRITSPRLTRTPLSWWTNITTRIRQSRRLRRHVWAAEDKEIAEESKTAEEVRLQKTRDG